MNYKYDIGERVFAMDAGIMKKTERTCDWCMRPPAWFVHASKDHRSSYMCDCHYNSHAKSPMQKATRLERPGG